MLISIDIKIFIIVKKTLSKIGINYILYQANGYWETLDLFLLNKGSIGITVTPY